MSYFLLDIPSNRCRCHKLMNKLCYGGFLAVLYYICCNTPFTLVFYRAYFWSPNLPTWPHLLIFSHFHCFPWHFSNFLLYFVTVSTGSWTKDSLQFLNATSKLQNQSFRYFNFPSTLLIHLVWFILMLKQYEQVVFNHWYVVTDSCRGVFSALYFR